MYIGDNVYHGCQILFKEKEKESNMKDQSGIFTSIYNTEKKYNECAEYRHRSSEAIIKKLGSYKTTLKVFKARRSSEDKGR